MSRRSRFVALVLSLAGFVGLHRFYLGRFWTGLLMLATLGGFGIWWVVDVYLILTGKLRDGDKQELAWFGGGSQPETPKSVASTSQPREASEQTQTSEAEPTKPDEETRGTAGMSTISLPGQTKVSTLQERFKGEFGLRLRVYDGRSFAEPDATIGQVRKKRGATSIDIRRNTKVGNLEDRFMEDFGIKVQIAGSDDSYLCDNDLTLAAALEEDERKLGRKATRAAAGEGQEPGDEQEEGDDQITDEFMINAAWEIRDERNICRYMVVWKTLNQSSIAGVLAGYSGGGSFQLEQFVAHYSNDKLTSLMIDMEDKITGREIDFFDDVPGELLELCDDAQDIVMEWNDQDEWEDAEQLLLLENREEELTQKEDLLLYEKGFSILLKEILEKAGITSAPISGS